MMHLHYSRTDTRNFYLFLVLLFGLGGPWGNGAALHAQNQGGPDAWGYTWCSGNGPCGPVYSWLDLPESARIHELATAPLTGPIPLGFSFSFYGKTYEALYVGADGYLTFGQPQPVVPDREGYPGFPTTGNRSMPHNLIAPLLTDLTFTDAQGQPIPQARCYAGPVGRDWFVVSFEEVPFWTDDNAHGYSGSVSFQVLLNRRTQSIQIQYRQVEGQADDRYASQRAVVAGMENYSGQIGTQLFENRYPEPGEIYLIHPSREPLTEIYDLGIDWVIQPGHGGQLLEAGSAPFDLQVSVSNVGTRLFDQPTELLIRTYRVEPDLQRQLIASEIKPLPWLQPETPHILEFPNHFTPDRPGNYEIEATLLAPDAWFGNNQQQAELVVFAPQGAETRLGYDSHTFRTTAPDYETLPAPEVNPLEVAVEFQTRGPLRVYGVEFDLLIPAHDPETQPLQGFEAAVYRSLEPDARPFWTDTFLPPPDWLTLQSKPQVTRVQLPLEVPMTTMSGCAYVVWRPLSGEAPEPPGTQVQLLAESGDLAHAPLSHRQYRRTPHGWQPDFNNYRRDVAVRLRAEPLPPETENEVSGQVFEDRNRNGQHDPGEPFLTNCPVYVGDPYQASWMDSTRTDAEGRYAFEVGVGYYSVAIPEQPFATLTAPATGSYGLFLFRPRIHSLGNDFGLVWERKPLFDLQIQKMTGQPRLLSPGTPVEVEVHSACLTDTARTATFVLQYSPAEFRYVSAQPAPTSVDTLGGRITWRYDPLLPFSRPVHHGKFVSRSVPQAGTRQTQRIEAFWQADLLELDRTNNRGTSAFVVETRAALPVMQVQTTTGAESAPGHENDTVTHQLTLMNTGATPITSLVVFDTLDTRYNPEQLKVDTASHSFILERPQEHVLRWTLLTDSLAPGGICQLAYRLQTDGNLPCGSLLERRIALRDGESNQPLGSAHQTTHFNPHPIAAFEYSPDPSLDGSVWFESRPSPYIQQYLWDFGQSADPRTAEGPGPHAVRYDRYGEDTVRLTVRSGNHCQATTTQTILFQGPVSAESLHTADGLENLLVYPNPTAGSCTVRLPAGTPPCQVQVRDVYGRTVIAPQPAHPPEHQINLSGQAAGLYLLEICRKDHPCRTVKLRLY